MIDWITAVLPFSDPEPIAGSRLVSITSDGEVDWEFDKGIPVVGSHSATIQVKSHSNGLMISGNPAKFIQGHNLFGGDDLQGLVEECAIRVCNSLNRLPSTDDFRDWRAGRYELKRVDCTAMWDLPKRADVRAYLRAMELQSKSRHGRPISRSGTVYFGKHSRRWALKFYSKGDELCAREKGHRLPDDIPHRDKLYDYADNKLRGELTLRAMTLKDRGLGVASSWSEETSRGQLLHAIESLDMADQFSLTPDAIADLPPRLQLVYKAWKNGDDMRALLPLRTFYRYRKELLKHGIDINVRQPSQPDNVIPLIRVLRPEAIAAVPDWARGTSLYFEPKKKAR